MFLKIKLNKFFGEIQSLDIFGEFIKLYLQEILGKTLNSESSNSCDLI